MPCNSGPIDLIGIDLANSLYPNAGPAVPDPNSPALFVSNAPEQIGPGDFTSWIFGTGPYNLCQVSIPAATIPNRVRVFLWHISRFSTSSFFGIIVGCPNGNGVTISNLKRVTNPDTNPIPNLSIAGMCLADAHLFGTLDNPLPSQTFYPNYDEKIIWSAQVNPGSTNNAEYQLIAGIFEFDISVPLGFNGDLTIRTAISLTGQSLSDFGTYSTPLAPNGNNGGGSTAVHNRGYWPHSDITMTIPGEFNCTLLGPPPKSVEYQYCDPSGPEAAYFSVANSSAKKGSFERPNTAAYGANLTYLATYRNHSAIDPARVYVSIRGRSTGQKYFGAGQVSKVAPIPSISGIPVKLPVIPVVVQVLFFPGITYAGYDLTSKYPSPNPVGHIAVGPSGTGTVQVKVANGGGAATPADLIISRELLWIAPTEGAG